MRPSAVVAPLVAASLARAALHIPIKRYASSVAPFHRVTAAAGSANTTTGVGSLNVINGQNAIYIGDIAIDGTSVPVQLDTGSADLWIYANDFPGILSNARNYTDISLNITYGIGSVSGNVSVIDIEFVDMPVPKQALLNALKTEQLDGLFEVGAYGVLGLGANSLSNIYLATQKKFNDSRGQTVLSNIFAANLTEPNHIAFFLDRMGDLEGSSPGTLSVGTYNTKYSAVQYQPELPVFDPNARVQRWSTLIDAVELSGKNITFGKSVVSGVPKGKALAVLDTGTTDLYMPKATAEAWFESIPSAVYVSTEDVWLVDCRAELQFAIWFKGNRFPIHPLDLTLPHARPLFSFPNATYCSFQVISTADGENLLDYLLGDVFLRNVYSVFDFGDTDPQTGKNGDPYIKLLSITDEATMIADFHASRNQSLAALPPLGNLTAVAAADKKANPSGASLASADAAGGNGSSDSSVGVNVNKLVGWAPAMLGLLGFNALALFALVVIGVALLRRGKGETGSVGTPRYQPLHLPPRKAEHAPYEEPLYEEYRYSDA
ncbi:hypothetical protein BOTBODRAFT_60803 [Botryobasidium botryosum FD-172 SS1]|uniref:Peptidase A1 domain-containing protein n=1 Tax=Botryobasidium botryosum (strain FD-172 SS1) TaxID=930990 RepID=A0A067M326_BOTB1|nr:hypothetical protein BOTBODRAFT_60803 [Botryobasidium botryosum FD-172 SS1]